VATLDLDAAKATGSQSTAGGLDSDTQPMSRGKQTRPRWDSDDLVRGKEPHLESRAHFCFLCSRIQDIP